MTNTELPQTCQTDAHIEYYLLGHQNSDTVTGAKYFAFQSFPATEVSRYLTPWEFMEKNELDNLLRLQRNRDVKRKIWENISMEYPKVVAKNVFVSLMYSVTKMCKRSGYDLSITGTALSIFYLTHLYFTNNLDTSAEKVYNYFKKLVMRNSVPLPPDCQRLLTFEAMTEVMQFFCKIYLRNLPLIRMLSLPNFGFYFNYQDVTTIASPDNQNQSSPEKKKGKEKKKKKK